MHQAQLQQAAGDWSEAVATVGSACDRLSDPPHPALGLACYQEAELHRLRGELDAAADAYGRANRSGFPPMPGLALLDLVRGEVAAATAGIRRALGETGQPFQRLSLLAAGDAAAALVPLRAASGAWQRLRGVGRDGASTRCSASDGFVR